MVREITLSLSPEDASREDSIRVFAARKLGTKPSSVTAVRMMRRSIDARRRDVKLNLVLRVYLGEVPPPLYEPVVFPDVSASAKSAIVAGFGPAGIFASLTLLENGIRPIVLERGQDVHTRLRDTARLSREGVLNPESNYAFGEGGAGAFSDGKLYTRSLKRGDAGKVLRLLVQHGADEEILWDSHPHIGSDRLPYIIEAMRETIVSHGGEVHFGKKVTGLIERGGVFSQLADVDVFRECLTVLNDAVAWDISGDRDAATCIDLDPWKMYEESPVVSDPLDVAA